MNNDSIPYGYCQCGCGQKTTLCPANNASKGMVKGTPRRYLIGHFSKTERFKTQYGTVEERFWSQVDKNGPNGCWLWTGSLHHGYGHLKFQGKDTNAHRVAWILTHGPLDSSIDVCHNCPKGDNRKCVNPDHMFLGTRSDNTKDLWDKGNGVLPPRPDNSGENSGRAVLTDAKVIELRRRYANGESIKSLMAFSGVNWVNTWKAATRRTWKHLP